MNNRILPLALLAALPLLSACVADATTQAKIDMGAQFACAGVEAGNSIFLNYAKIHAADVDMASKVKTEDLIYTGLHEACKPPYTGDVATLIKKATDAAIAITSLMGT